MTELLVTALRIGFLAFFWIFIWFIANTIKTDMFGKPVSRDKPSNDAAMSHKATRKRRRRGEPVRVAVTEGKSVGSHADLIGIVTIGRGNDVSLHIDDDYSSTQHAQLSKTEDGSWVVEDLHSTNGTYVNGIRITMPTVLGLSDVVRIGRTQLRLEK